jgi:hypothetical protein
MEVGLELHARSLGAAWSRKGAEAAAVTVSVDGKYHQDLLLWAGEDFFKYRISLGRLRPGKHRVAVALNQPRSSPGAAAEVISISPLLLNSIHKDRPEDLFAFSHSPILYARANTIDRFSDVPLLMYYETRREPTGDFTVRYTVIFSNEDGGTSTAALMARWGRTTDIEWVYELTARNGRVTRRTYQGLGHETKPFTGEALAEHPLIAVTSDNNNFSDLACSAVRFAPLPFRAHLDQSSRETLMDAHPWTYRIMAEELSREGRVSAAPADLHTIADPRHYLFVETYAEQAGTAIAVEAVVDGDTTRYSSDLGDSRLRVDRSGFARIAVRLPSPAATSKVSAINLRCYSHGQPGGERVCKRAVVKKAVVLDNNYLPRNIPVAGPQAGALAPGSVTAFEVVR